MEKIRFQLADGTVEEFFIEEQTRIGGVSYLLVSDSMEDEASAYILKDVSKDTDPEACYEIFCLQFVSQWHSWRKSVPR